MSNAPDTLAIARLYQYLRICDVSDALDAVGRPGIMLMDPAIRPIFQGIKFWGPAVTMRAIPANKYMRVLSREEAVRVHQLWFEDVGWKGTEFAPVTPGVVVVTDARSCGEVGVWGSMNSLDAIANGAVGIITDGCARDTRELTMTRTPVVCRQRGRTIIPGRNLFTDSMEPVGCGGVLVRPGDIVGCDDDGCLCVPAEIAEEVGKIASDILIDDEKARHRLYGKLGLPLDDTVNVEMLEEFYKPWR